jgi:hypothetical protein
MSIHEDTVQGLQEALAYAQGSLQLKETVVEVNDDEIVFYSIFSKLSEPNKTKLMNYANDLLHASNA